MTLMRDVAVVSDRARFRVPELLRGVADCYLGARLASRVGVGRAKWPLFSESLRSEEVRERFAA
jgi:enoyl-CoA hydratase/carnithine racemase